MSPWPSPDRFDPQPTLEGDLVRLRPLRAEDHDALFAVASDPLVWDQHPNRDRYRPEVFRAFFREAMDRGGALAVLDAATGEIIGSSRYHGYDGARSEVEVGWSFLARKYWGGRYNGEMKRLMLDHAFRYVDHVIFVIGPENLRSRRAVEKIGAVFHEVRVVDQGERCIYRIAAPRVAARTGAPGAGGGAMPRSAKFWRRLALMEPKLRTWPSDHPNFWSSEKAAPPTPTSAPPTMVEK